MTMPGMVVSRPIQPTCGCHPDTRDLECSEIKTQVELATGRLGHRRAAREHSFLKCCSRENGASATGEASPLENSLE